MTKEQVGDGKKQRKEIRKLRRKLRKLEQTEQLEKLQKKIKKQKRKVEKARQEVEQLKQDKKEKELLALARASRSEFKKRQQDRKEAELLDLARQSRDQSRKRKRDERSEKERDGREEKHREQPDFDFDLAIDGPPSEEKKEGKQRFGRLVKELKIGQKMRESEIDRLVNSDGQFIAKVDYINQQGIRSTEYVTITKTQSSEKKLLGNTYLKKLLSGNWWEDHEFEFFDKEDSGPVYNIMNAQRIISISILKVKNKNRTNRRNQRAAAFNYVLSEHYKDLEAVLSPSQIYTTNTIKSKVEEKCLLYCFHIQGITDPLIAEIIMKHSTKRLESGWEVTNLVKPQKVLEEISQKLKRPINLQYLESCGKRKNGMAQWRIIHKDYGKNFTTDPNFNTEPIFIALMENHIFVNPWISVTDFYLKNPEMATNLSEKANKNPVELYSMGISHGKPCPTWKAKQPRRLITVLRTIMAQENLYTKINTGIQTKTITELPALNYLDQKVCTLNSSTKKVGALDEGEKKQPSYINVTYFFAADIESDIISSKEHTPLMCGFESLPIILLETCDEGQKNSEYFTATQKYDCFEGLSCVKDMFSSMSRLINQELPTGIKAKIDRFNQSRVEDEVYDSKLNARARKAVKEIKPKKGGTVFFHNLKYDFSVLKDSIKSIQTVVSKSVSTLYGIQFNHARRIDNQMEITRFTLKDSFKYMSWPLAHTQKELGLSEEFKKKEFIAYEYFTLDNLRAPPVDAQTYLDFYNNEHKTDVSIEEFTSTIPKGCFTENGLFDALKYYHYYLKWDCKILAAGMMSLDYALTDLYVEFKSKGISLDLPSIFDQNVYTIPGFARSFFTKNGALDKSFQSVGSLKEFIHESFYGGRVVSNKLDTIDQLLEYLDACSLYPAAMVKLIEEFIKGGITNGEALVLQDNEKNTEFLADKQDYTVRVKITGMSKRQACKIGVLPERKDSKVIYHHEWPGYEFTGVYGKIMLEDAVEILGLQYEILEGVYWNMPTENQNYKYAQLTRVLYDVRMKYKKTNKALAQLIKLILNSGCYGCLARKPSYTKNIIKPTNAAEQYLANSFDEIERFRPLSKNCVLFEVKTEDENYTSVKIACNVLDASKKIMNRVFSACSEAGVIVPYSDTDSFVIPRENREEVIRIYEEKTGLVFDGNQLGQFHSDFSIKGKNLDENHIVSREFRNIGKKLYFHDLIHTDPETGVETLGYKMSCKGFTKTGMVHYAQQAFNEQDERLALLKLFRSVSEGNSHEINLFPTRKSRIGYNSNLVAHSISNAGEFSFTRLLKKEI